jgi:hypothetical protein
VFFYNNSGSGATINWTISISGPNCQDPTVWDSRVNREPWATAVVYCVDHAIQIYDVDLESHGHLLFIVTPEEIDEVGIPNVNTVLESAQGTRGTVTVFRLVGGEFQLVAPELQPGKIYSFVWNGC